MHPGCVGGREHRSLVSFLTLQWFCYLQHLQPMSSKLQMHVRGGRFAKWHDGVCRMLCHASLCAKGVLKNWSSAAMAAASMIQQHIADDAFWTVQNKPLAAACVMQLYTTSSGNCTGLCC